MAKIQIRNIDHLVLRVRDIDAMRAFYCDVLGAEHIAYRPSSPCRIFASAIACSTSSKRRNEASPRRKPAASTSTISAFASNRSIRKRSSRTSSGTTFPSGPIRDRYGAEGNGVSIYLTDPEGNTVELKGPSDGKPPPPPPAS